MTPSGSARRYSSGEDRSSARNLFARVWWLTRARSVLARADDREAKRVAAGAAAYYAASLMRLGRGAASQKWARVAASEAQACGDMAALAEAYDVMDMVNFVSGEPAGSYWDQALESYVAIGRFRRAGTDPRQRGVGLQSEGRFADAMAAYEKSKQIAEQIDDRYSAAVAMMNEAEIYSDLGLLDQAEELLRVAARFFRASGDNYMLAGSLQYLGRVLSRSGRVDEAESALQEAEDGFVAMGATPDAAEVQLVRAECHVLCREPREAMAELDRALATDPEAAGAVALRVRAYAQAQLGLKREAIESFAEAVEDARQRDALFDVYEGILGLLRLGAEDASASLFDESKGIVAKLGIVAVTCPPL